MASKKENIKITFDSIWFKIFMDSNETYFYGKEIFIAPGLSGDKFKFFQLIGNVGGYSRDNDFDKDIDVVVIPDKLLERLRNNDKDPFLQNLEDLINSNNTPYRKLIFITEELTLNYLTDRAKGILNSNSSVDHILLNQIKLYKSSAKEVKQQSLF